VQTSDANDESATCFQVEAGTKSGVAAANDGAVGREETKMPSSTAGYDSPGCFGQVAVEGGEGFKRTTAARIDVDHDQVVGAHSPVAAGESLGHSLDNGELGGGLSLPIFGNGVLTG
jgi:hypothetical protein